MPIVGIPYPINFYFQIYFMPFVAKIILDEILFKKVRLMIDAQALMRVRKAVESNIGERVKLKANRGRKKSLVKEGVIQEVYPCIFTVRVNIDDRSVQTLSFTYFDILTSNVEVVICKNNERI